MRWGVTTCLLALLAFGRAGTAQTDGPAPVPGPTPGPGAARTGRTPSASRLIDARAVCKRLGLVPEYEGVAGVEAIKVAVLDYGFEGIESGRPYLPGDAVVVEHYDPEFIRRFGLGDPEYRKPFEPGNSHGRVMAQIVWAVTGARPQGPKFFLLNANGPTMLRRAVRYAIEERVDVVLFSGTFEGGGNGDGRGFINNIVADATAAGILWVNAAGNYGHRVFNGPVRLLPDAYLRLRPKPDVTALRFRNRVDENTVTVTLIWNDYRGEEDAGTGKDLDLFVEDWAGRRVGSGDKAQVRDAHAAGPDESRNPRERVVLTNLPANPDRADSCYRIRVRARSGHFTADDRIRILLTASRETFVAPGRDAPTDAVEFLDATGQEELFPPADNPMVVTVGDNGPGSSVGPTADRRVKPDLVLEDSRAFFTDGQVSYGSSNAAAYFAGVVAVLKAAEPGLSTRHLLKLASHGAAPMLPTEALGTAALTAPEPRGRELILEAARPVPAPLAARWLGLHTWQTPGRARLARIVRDDR